ncbi:CARDB domain-containing protein [Halostella litorea]|uniref:CARDB domain-containing protein n=1 Tax=Halostella litorea TaxID=2528831 RepID=UPI001092E376|nr:CARDB domain-containing protein [Halostella litorea]
MGDDSHAEGRLVSLALAATAVGVALAALPAAGAAGVPGAASASDVQTPPDADVYAVTQGGNCVEVTPFGDDARSVSDFYEYGLHTGLYSSQGTRELQSYDESQLLLYDGSEGGSVVFIHGAAGSETGGSVATVRMSGLPSGGEWAVRDDNYTNRMDNFTHEGSTARADWWWERNRTDGGAFRGLERGAYGEITIEPAFNRDAPYATLDTSATIDDWLLRSADGRTVRLAMDRPVTIRPGRCDDASVQVARNDTERYDATVRNAPAADETTFDPSIASDRGAALDGVSVGHGDADWFRFGLNRTNATAAADAPLPADPLLTVAPEGPTADNAGDVAYAFSVARDRFEEVDRSVGDVALFQYRDGEWRRLDHRTERDGDAVRFRTADANESGPVAVGLLRPSIRVTNLSLSPTEVDPHEDVSVTATVANDGEGNGTREVRLSMFGQTVDRQQVRVPPGETRTVTFSRAVESPGTYDVAVGDAEQELVVEGDGGGDGTFAADGAVPPTLLVGAVLSLLVAAVVGLRAG